ncbi:MAG TPA: 23S rRNA (uracil(1939)-C(5))-methyltransferase RlmD [Lachnospiraceae bacterium]|nr:23S rRNA (uracil(1939)-C(5))-methyltransferase RlmD [Lachnospiraceae bacterium]
MKKGEMFQGKITRVDFPNKCRVETENGQVIQVKNGIPGQTVSGIVQKKRGGRLAGRILEVIEASPLETGAPLCSIFPACGGCTYQTMAYERQLEMKKAQVKQLLDEALRTAGQVDGRGEPDYVFEGIMPSPTVLAYRNKMEFSFGDAYQGGPLTLGLHKKESTYDILPAGDCKIVHKDFCAVLNCVQEYFRENPVPVYRKMRHTGCLRHLLVRRSISSGEILAALVTTSQETLHLDRLKERLLELPLEGHLSGILHIVNDSPADVVQSDRTEILYGREDFYEELLGLKFRITPFSFFQTNTKGAEVLYETAREFIGDTKGRVIYDLYSGTGTIAQILAPLAARVVGVEIVPEAVEAARENAALNGLTNCQFLAGDVLKMLDEIEEMPDLIVLDPPRDGVNPKALRKIIGYGVERMVYISCKPTSLARDLEMLIGGGYVVERVRCVDMFPFACHVETVCLLSNRKSKPDTHVDLTLDMEDYYRIKDQEKQSNK